MPEEKICSSVDQRNTEQKSDNANDSAIYFVTLIKSHRTGKKMKKIFNKKTDENPFDFLSETENSLKINNTKWVDEFLDNKGLEALTDLFFDELVHFQKKMNIKSRKVSSGLSTLKRKNTWNTIKLAQNFLTRLQLSSDMVNESVIKCLNQGISCIRTILNTKRGCNMAFEHSRIIDVIALCHLHPNYRIKTSALETLTAISLIGDGLKKVLAAFDYIKIEIGENTRFETLISYFREHINFQYDIDFMVKCVQFINIIVHSGEDFNLRVDLQQNFTALGVDEIFKKLDKHSDDCLMKQIEAYNYNRIDVASLNKASFYNEKFGKLQNNFDINKEKDHLPNKSLKNKLSDLVQLPDISQNLKDESQNADMTYEENIENNAENSIEIPIITPKMISINQDESNSKVSPFISLSVNSSSVASLSQTIILQTNEFPQLINSSNIITSLPTTVDLPQIDFSESTVAQSSTISPLITVNQPSHLASIVHSNSPPSPISSPIVSLVPLAPSPSTILPILVVPPPPILVVPPPPILVPPPPILVPPPPMSPPIDNISPAALKRKSIQTKYKLPVFNWSAIKFQQVEDTVFKSMNDENLYDRLEFDEFENIFKLKAIEISKQNRNKDIVKQKEPKKKTFLENKQLISLGILLRFLKQEKINIDDLCILINNFEISSEIAEKILIRTNFPTKNDKSKYLKYEEVDKLPITNLNDEDILLMHLCKIVDLEVKLKVNVYLKNFSENYKTLDENVTIISESSVSVRNSQKLKKILEIILAYGNLMNSSKQGMIYGFRLQSLDLLTEMKSVDKSWTFMQFLVKIIHSKFPSLIEFLDELKSLQQASKIPLELITNNVVNFVNFMKNIPTELKKSSKLKCFVDENEPLTLDLFKKAQDAKEKFLFVTKSFGEKETNSKPDVFFDILYRFTENFRKAMEEISKKPVENMFSSYVDDETTEEFKLNSVTLISGKRNSQIYIRTQENIHDGIIDEILAALEKGPFLVERRPEEINDKDQSEVLQG